MSRRRERGKDWNKEMGEGRSQQGNTPLFALMKRERDKEGESKKEGGTG